jgi:hypothetical protein
MAKDNDLTIPFATRQSKLAAQVLSILTAVQNPDCSEISEDVSYQVGHLVNRGAVATWRLALHEATCQPNNFRLVCMSEFQQRFHKSQSNLHHHDSKLLRYKYTLGSSTIQTADPGSLLGFATIASGLLGFPSSPQSSKKDQPQAGRDGETDTLLREMPTDRFEYQ